MLEKLKYLSNFYNSGKFLELQAELNSFDKDEIEGNKHLLKLCLLNAGQLGNETGCINLSISFLRKYNLDFEAILFFYINAEKSKKLNIFYESYFKLLNNIEFKSIIKNKQTGKLINFFISKNEDELALLTIRQLFRKKK